MDVKGLPQLIPSADRLAIAQLNQKQFPLLRLPGELRSRVYDLVMDGHINKIVHDDFNDWDRLDFSRTCRQIFAETAHAYFQKRLLPLSTSKGVSFHDPENLKSVFDRLTPMQKRHIKVFFLNIKPFLLILSTYYAILLLKSMPRLRVFNIMVPSYPRLRKEITWHALDTRLLRCSSARPYFVHEQHDSLEL